MNLNRTLIITRKSLLEMLREPVLLVISLLLPAFFLLLNYASYGNSPKTATYPVLVVSQTRQAEPLIAALKDARYADGRPYFVLREPASDMEAESALKDQSAALLIRFSEDEAGKIQYTLRGDAVNMAYTKASVQLESVLAPYIDRLAGRPELITIEDKGLGLARPLNDFDAYAPGMMVFAVLLLIPQTALLIGREIRKGTLRRLALTAVRPVELFAGLALSQMVFAALQVVLMLAAALALGFHLRGSLSLALVISLVLAFGAIGMGLAAACFMRNDSDALNTGSSITMLQVFLSGAFFAFPAPTLFVLGSHAIGAFDFLPATHAMLALQQVMVGGAGWQQVGFRLGAAAGLSVFYFGLGVVIFSLRQRVLLQK